MANKRTKFQGTPKQALQHRGAQIDALVKSFAERLAKYGVKSAADLPDNWTPPKAEKKAAEVFVAGETVYLTRSAHESFASLLQKDADAPFRVEGATGALVACKAKSGARVMFNSKQVTHTKAS